MNATNTAALDTKSGTDSEVGWDWFASHTRHATKSMKAETPAVHATALHGPITGADLARGAA